MANEEMKKQREAAEQMKKKQLADEVKINTTKIREFVKSVKGIAKKKENIEKLNKLEERMNNLPSDDKKAKAEIQEAELAVNSISFDEVGINWFIGIPSGRFMFTAWVSQFIGWFTQYPAVTKISESNRVDLNRSDLIHYAKKTNLNMIMIDSDGMVQTPLAECVKYLQEDFDAGYEVVLAPVRAITGTVLIEPVNEGDIKTDAPFEAVKGSLTFIGISKTLLARLDKLNDYGLVNEEFKPMYLTYLPNNSEDYQFCDMVRSKYNVKIACDPRIKVGHYKSFTLPPV